MKAWFSLFQLTADEPLDAMDIGVGVEENTVRDLSISAGSPRLLVVTFNRFRETGVDHVAHIRLVNAHAKSYGGTNDLADKREQ